MSKVVNFVAGPGVGKSVMTALVFAKLKMQHKNAEIVPEYAKQLVWMNEIEMLNNQYYVTHHQHKLLKALDGKVDYIVTDGSLLNGLVYNMIYPDNTSDKNKTEQAIMDWFNSYNNVTIFLERNTDFGYQEEGRLQKLEEAIHIDNLLKFQLFDKKIEYKSFKSTEDNIQSIIDYIEKGN